MSSELWYTKGYTLEGFMSLLLKLKEDDLKRLEKIKKGLKLKSKISVLRYALNLVEKEMDREAKIKKWREVAKRGRETSREVNKEIREAFGGFKDEWQP